MALSNTTRILALFILGLSVACVALLVSLVIKTNNSSDSGMNVLTYICLVISQLKKKNKFTKTSIKFLGPDNVISTINRNSKSKKR